MERTFNLNTINEVVSELLQLKETRVWLFKGEMGVGKTTLIKELAKQLGVKDTLSSPTFSIVNEYQTSTEKIFHFDFYRIKSEDEAMDMGVEEYFYSGHFNFIEWPEKIETLIPQEYVEVTLNKNKNGSRTVNLKLVN
ncbi:tRNA (adenosine(37)-N6)-threonylcarbamoyltransferase complex ATPase subunit type 1 TsaE [Patiriisocius hiemis]|uniref:tRNA threonylcarbamoyladenosine biosynthesis protein TsaE n=1 Tax=Patiriisocius hiemis TaxID=3075604 RepID=A0ABU2Y9M5_9FLAO|nr:tRNA (adenosine(37)-N6)-threonylcarbamoyltransferase complex ATPase subunit type 1 TsaE [Constantimarinum sp. W242]MDT0554886.1 tRNA (adenosine(37)-N6)-threonylcarbamoyltransferase complex ATPase subunit type 1 TsaE [Constantimarinum sp. W242]